MNGRSFSNEGYRFGFNGKERDNETFTDAYDFGARILDTRLGRWLAVDPLHSKYESYSAYHFGYNNPIITIDFDGRENIIVVGGADKNGNKMKFINTGLKQLSNHLGFNAQQIREGKAGEMTTIILFDIGLTKRQINKINKRINILKEKRTDLNLILISKPEELVNYINSKEKDKKDLSSVRENDQITDITFFGHGYHHKFGNKEGGVSSFEVGHSYFSINSKEHDDLTFNEEDIKDIDTKAFQQSGSNCVFFSCNAAEENDQGKSLAKTMSLKMGKNSTVTGWDGRTSYEHIYGITHKDDSFDDQGICTASSLPVGGNKSEEVGKGKAEKIVFKGGIKQ
jgi:RHS repeat-associated protein